MATDRVATAREARPHASTSHVAYAIFFLLGVASSLPWNVFVTAQSYFQHRLAGTPYEASFVNWFSTGFFITTLLAMLVRTVCVADRMPSAVKTLFSALVVMLAVMFGHTVLTRMPEFFGVEFFKLTMASIVVVATASTLMQDGLLRLVSTFPPQFTQGVVSGQAMAGVVVSISNLAILAANPSTNPAALLTMLAGDADLSAFAYFVFVFIVVLLSTLAFVILTRMKFFRYYHYHGASEDKPYMRKPTASTDDDDLPSREKLLSGSENGDRGYDEDASEDPDRELYLVDLTYKIRLHGATVFLVFCISVAVFPGVTSLLSSSDPSKGRLFGDLFVPATFVLFNTFDLLGRWSAVSFPTLTAKQLLLAALSRIAICPLFMLCRLQNEHHQVVSIVLFKSDVFPALFIIAAAFTNGLFSTQALMQYPRMLASSREKEMGGTIMFFLLSLGLCAGALLSFVLLAMLKP